MQFPSGCVHTYGFGYNVFQANIYPILRSVQIFFDKGKVHPGIIVNVVFVAVVGHVVRIQVAESTNLCSELKIRYHCSQAFHVFVVGQLCLRKPLFSRFSSLSIASDKAFMISFASLSFDVFEGFLEDEHSDAI